MRKNLGLQVRNFKLSKKDLKGLSEVAQLVDSDRSKALRAILRFIRYIIDNNPSAKRRLVEYMLDEEKKGQEVNEYKVQQALKSRGIEWEPGREWTKDFK